MPPVVFFVSCDAANDFREVKITRFRAIVKPGSLENPISLFILPWITALSISGN